MKFSGVIELEKLLMRYENACKDLECVEHSLLQHNSIKGNVLNPGIVIYNISTVKKVNN